MASGRPAHAHPRVRRAFTLLELMITVAAMLIVVLAVMPALGMGVRTRLVAATMNLVSDIEYARSLAISEPEDPALVRLMEDKSGYWLALSSAPDTPIARHNGSAYSVVFGEGEAYLLHGVEAVVSSPHVQGVEGRTIRFDAFGRRVPGYDAAIVVSATNDHIVVRVSAATGDVWID